MDTTEQEFAAFREQFELLLDEVNQSFVGQPDVVENLLLAFFCGGHVLLEGMPGLGKTLLVKTLGRVLGLDVSRIQCTPDLMPSDIIGTNMLIEDGHGNQSIRFERGPIFSNVVLIDEVNRATPKTQSAFLEAMQERRVTALGATYELDEPFFVLATENPIEIEGTFPLPEAQLDRFFFKLGVRFPSLDELSRIVDLTTGEQAAETPPEADSALFASMASLVRKVKVAERVKQYALRLVTSSHPEADGAPETVRRFVKYGASPRAAQSLVLGAKARAVSRGRYNVSVDDLAALASPSLNHRIILNFEADVEGIDSERVIADLLDTVQP